MKELGRYNITREQLDEIFTEGHNGISIATMVDKIIVVSGFAIYAGEDGAKSLKIIDTAGRDYYTSSQVFVKNFIIYMQSKQDADFPVDITVKEATSKKGRKYLTIEEAASGDGNNDGWRNLTF